MNDAPEKMILHEIVLRARVVELEMALAEVLCAYFIDTHMTSADATERMKPWVAALKGHL